MPIKAKVYIGTVIATGLACAVWAGQNLSPTDPVKTLCYFFITVLVSSMKVSLPGLSGAMSAGSFCILIGLVELSLAESLLVGLGSAFVQSLWKAKTRPKAARVCFNASVIFAAISAAHVAFHAPLPWDFAQNTLVRLTLVACIYYLLNTLPVAVVIALTESRSLRIWREYYLRCFPFYLLGSALAGLARSINSALGSETTVLAFPVVILLHRAYSLYLDRLASEKQQIMDMASLHLRTIEALALAIDAKDATTYDHLRRVQVFSVAIAKDLQLTSSETEAIRAAALLHDIGKLAVPEHIISKPGKLTPQEFQKVKIHPIVGAEILRQVDFPYPVVPIVRSHHEKWDGTGYPDGLRGEEIPIGARILSAVDCLDAMASDRPWRKAMPLEKAIASVVREAGKSYDPRVVEILARRYRELEEQTQRVLSTQRPLTPVEPLQPVPNPLTEKSGARPALDAAGGDFISSIAAARQEVQMLFEVTHDLGNSLSLNETLSVLSVRLKRLIPYDSIAIYVKCDNDLKPEHVNGEDFRLLSGLRIPLGEGLSGWVAQNQKPILNGNPSAEAAYLNDSRVFTVLRSALAVPLEDDQSNVVAVMTLYRMEKDAFTDDNLRILTAITGKIGIAITNALRFQQAEIHAANDALTGLPNARSLFLHLQREISAATVNGSRVAVLVCDLDGFKSVNDRYGHLEGNRLLQAVAQSFRDSLREKDYVARMGGDEFVFVLPGMGPLDAERMVPRIEEAARSASTDICGQDVVAASVGVAVFPYQGTDADGLLSIADKRMYRTKADHRSRTRVSGVPVTAPAQLVQ